MKKIESSEKVLLFAIIYFITIFVTSTLNAQIVETETFKVEYDQKLQQPLWVEYTITCPNGKVSRHGMDFWVPEGYNTSDNNDYRNNIWDKGHLAPAASFSCSEELLYSTFSYLNSALQHEGLNRGQWSRLEAFERDAAKFFDTDIHVRVDVLFTDESKVLKTGATVPSGFVKTITIGEVKRKFVFPNEDTKGTNWIDYIKE